MLKKLTRNKKHITKGMLRKLLKDRKHTTKGMLRKLLKDRKHTTKGMLRKLLKDRKYMTKRTPMSSRQKWQNEDKLKKMQPQKSKGFKISKGTSLMAQTLSVSAATGNALRSK